MSDLGLALRDLLGRRYRYVLIDEYQDFSELFFRADAIDNKVNLFSCKLPGDPQAYSPGPPGY